MGTGESNIVVVGPEENKKTTTVDFRFDFMRDPMGVLEKMYQYMEFYKGKTNTKYVVNGSIIGCNYGCNLTKIGVIKDHAVYDNNKNAVLTCGDCLADENVYNFGLCGSPILGKNSEIATIELGVPYAPGQKRVGYKCKLQLSPRWQTGKVHTHIWNIKTNQYEPILPKDGVLTCAYGAGIITIKEVNSTGAIKEYVNLEIMDKMGWKQIHCGYVIKDTEIDSPISDRTSEITRKHRSIDQSDIDKLNMLFDKFDITTKNRICAFFAECSAETNNGKGMVERAGTDDHPLKDPATRPNVEQWIKTYRNYEPTYRGGGAIQLTWKYNYAEFSNWMVANFDVNDSNILELGAEYVGVTYPWEAGVFYWDDNNLNSIADTMSATYVAGEVHRITEVVNEGMSKKEYALREDAYKEWMEKYIIPK